MKRMLTAFAFLAVFVLALSACGGRAAPFVCEDAIGCVTYGPDAPVRIASALVLTGPESQLGIDSQRGVEIAIDFKGELLGHTIELHAEDDGCSAEGGRAAGQRIVSDPSIIGIVGTSCSGAGIPISKVVSEAGHIIISPSDTSPFLTDPDVAWNAGFLRTAPNDKLQGAAMADFAYNELGVTTAATIHDGSQYTEALALGFADSFQELGGRIILFTAVNRGATDMRPVLSIVATAGPPELIYYPIFTAECSILSKQAGEVSGLENTILSAADGCISAAAAEAIGDSGEGIYFSGPNTEFTGEAYTELLARYEELFGPTLSVFHSHSFDATNLILGCVETVATQDKDGTLHVGRQDMRDCLYATSGYVGITGTLTCDQYGDCADTEIVMKQLQNGEYVQIWAP